MKKLFVCIYLAMLMLVANLAISLLLAPVQVKSHDHILKKSHTSTDHQCYEFNLFLLKHHISNKSLFTLTLFQTEQVMCVCVCLV